MAFFRNILSSKRVDINMEAGNHSDLELDDMEAGSGSAPHLKPDNISTLDRDSTFPYLFPAPNIVPNAAFPLFSPSQISSTTRKCSQDDNRISKVQVVEQISKIPAIVCLHSP